MGNLQEENLGLSGEGNDIHVLNAHAKAGWPENFLMSIFGWSKLSTTAMLESCPEILGDITYIMEHISKSKPAYACLLYELFREHMTMASIAARHRMRLHDLQIKLVEIISCIRSSHLPSLISVGLRDWKKKQLSVRNEPYDLQRMEPLSILDSLGAFELEALSALGCTTIGDMLNMFRSVEGLTVDGINVTEDAVRKTYEELELLHVLSNASERGEVIPFRIKIMHNRGKSQEVRACSVPEWPMNLWTEVVTDMDILPPEDLLVSVNEALEIIPARHKECLLEIYKANKSCVEYASETGVKPSAVYTMRKAAIESCRVPHIERLFLMGQEECRRQERDFRLSALREMRTYPTSILPIQTWRMIRVIGAADSVGSLLDRLMEDSLSVQQSEGRKAEMGAIYQALDSAGVIRKCWGAGINVKNPSTVASTDLPAPLRSFLNDLWGDQQDVNWNLQIPRDIMSRLDFALTVALRDTERELLQKEYPALRYATIEELARADIMMERDERIVNPAMEVLRNCVAMSRPSGPVQARSKRHPSYRWPDNLLRRVFQCGTLEDLVRYIPEEPDDIEQAIEYIFKTKLSDQAASMLRAYFQDGKSYREIGADCHVSGSYVGAVIKSALENQLRSGEAKRYFRLGYARAKEEESRYKAAGITEETLHRPVDDFPFERRVANALCRAKVKTLEEVADVLRGTRSGGVSGFGVCSRWSAYVTLNKLGVVDYYSSKGTPIPIPRGKCRRGHEQ